MTDERVISYLKQLGIPPRKKAQIFSEPFHSISVDNNYVNAPQQFLYFLPLPHEQGSLRPILGPVRIGAG